MRVYISGRISGLPKFEYIKHFAKAQEELEALGHSVINPAAVNSMLPADITYEEYVKMSFCMLEMADAIYMLDNWEESCGANRELGYAMAKGMKILYE